MAVPWTLSHTQLLSRRGFSLPSGDTLGVARAPRVTSEGEWLVGAQGPRPCPVLMEHFMFIGYPGFFGGVAHLHKSCAQIHTGLICLFLAQV